MKRKLILLRHAKSAWDTGAPDDHARPLNKRGRRDAPRLAARLVELGWKPDRILASDSERTRETYERMKSALGKHPKPKFTAKLYMADLAALRRQLTKSYDKVRTVLALGHNPGWEEAVKTPTGEEVRPGTCNPAPHNNKADTWAEALTRTDWKLEAVVRPKEL